MPEMETKFPDYTGKLTKFAMNKIVVIRYNFVNFLLSVLLLLCFSGLVSSLGQTGLFFFSFCKLPI